MSTFNDNPHVVESDDIEELLAISAAGRDGRVIVSLTVRLREGAEVELDGSSLSLALDGILPKLLQVGEVEPVAVDADAPAADEAPVSERETMVMPVVPAVNPDDVPTTPIHTLSLEDKGASHES